MFKDNNLYTMNAILLYMYFYSIYTFNDSLLLKAIFKKDQFN